MTDHAPAFLLWMKLTDSKSFMTTCRPASDHSDGRAAPWVFPIASADAFSRVTINQAH